MEYRVNRIVLFILLFSACLYGCSKTNDVPAQISTQLIKDDAIISKYLQINNIVAKQVDSVSTTTGENIGTGIYYKIDTASNAVNLFTSSTQVTLGWTAWYLTSNATLGPVLGSTDQFNPSFVLGGTLRAWQLGIPETNAGGVITLYVPSKYAYGPFPQPTLNLPANAVLIFHISLYNVTN